MSLATQFRSQPGDAVAAGDPSMVYELSPSLVLVAQPDGSAAESIRALRAHIMVQHLEQGRRGFAVCAPTRQVGCSFVAANLAISLAQAGVNTLLIDADFREPAIEDLIRPQVESPGLSDLLAGQESDMAALVHRGVLPNLSVLFAGRSRSESHELLANPQFEEAMSECMRDYDCTIIDSPPANISSDSRRAAAVVGYALLVARRHKTQLGDLKVFAEQLESDRVTIIGTVLNEA
jgi:protein-tyrosine kinase